MDLEWKNAQATVIHGASHLPESLIEAMSVLAYPIVWSLTIAASIGILVLAAVVSLLLALVCLPCFVGGKAWSQDIPLCIQDQVDSPH